MTRLALTIAILLATPLCAEGYVEDSRSEANVALLGLGTALQKRFDESGGRIERHHTPLELQPTLYFEHFSAENYKILYPASLNQPVRIRCIGTFRGDFWEQTMELSLDLVRRTSQRTHSPHEPFLFEILPRWGSAIGLLLPIWALLTGDAIQRRRRQHGKSRRFVSIFFAFIGLLLFIEGSISATYVRLEYDYELRFISLLFPFGIVVMELSGRFMDENPGKLIAVAFLSALATTAILTDFGATYWYGGSTAAFLVVAGSLVSGALYLARFTQAHPRTKP